MKTLCLYDTQKFLALQNFGIIEVKISSCIEITIRGYDGTANTLVDILKVITGITGDRRVKKLQARKGLFIMELQNTEN